jgi:hypothetical protein
MDTLHPAPNVQGPGSLPLAWPCAVPSQRALHHVTSYKHARDTDGRQATLIRALSMTFDVLALPLAPHVRQAALTCGIHALDRAAEAELRAGGALATGAVAP